MRPIDLPSPETIAKFTRLSVAAAPGDTNAYSPSPSAKSMRKTRQSARDAIGKPGQFIIFKWGNLDRLKSGTILKINHNATIITVACGKNQTRFSVPAHQIVRR